MSRGNEIQATRCLLQLKKLAIVNLGEHKPNKTAKWTHCIIQLLIKKKQERFAGPAPRGEGQRMPSC
jgi:hypothetical protein